MKSIPCLRSLFVCLLALVVLTGSTRAATLIWNGGSGNWDLTSTNWLNGTAVAWNNSLPDEAVFNAPGTTITLLAEINALALTFNNTGTVYTFAGSGGSLSFNSITLAPGVTSVRFGDTGPVTVIANAPGAISDGAPSGSLDFYSGSTLSATQTGAIGGSAQINLFNSTLNVNVTDALTSQAVVNLGTAVGGNGAATLRLNGHSTSVGTVNSGITDSVIENDSSTEATLRPFLDTNTDSTFAGVIQDGLSSASLSVFKQGSFNWYLSGANTYTGGTTLGTGGLYANSSQALGTGPLTILSGTFGSGAGGTFLSNSIIINGNFNIAPPLALAGGLALNGGITMTVTPVITNTVAGGSVTFANEIDGVGGLTLDATGGWGRFILRASNAYVGLTTVQGNAQLQLDSYFGTPVRGDLLVQGNGVVQLTGGAGQQIATTSRVTVNSLGNTIDGTVYEGLVLQTVGGGVTLAALNGAGTVGLYGSDLIIGSGDFSGVISDAGNPSFGDLTKATAGTLILSGANTYSGETFVNDGVLLVNNTSGSGTGSGDIEVSGAVLGGSGTIAGNVNFDDGILRPGNSPGTLTILGNLVLNSGSTSEFELGQAGVPGGTLNDLVNVGGDLTIAGDLAITESSGGTFGPGVYRLFNYGGTLTDNIMTLVSAPVPLTDLVLQTSVANQVNLVNTQGLQLTFWDGSGPADNGVINGGSGVWISPDAIPTSQPFPSWTTAAGTFNAGWENGSYAIFQGTGGNVTVGSNPSALVTLTGAQFAVDGYTLSGGALTGTGASTTFQVGDGTSASAAMTATINSVMEGNTSLVKTGAGRLVLSSANTYTGGTALQAGALYVANTSSGGLGTGPLTISANTTLGQQGTSVSLNNAVVMNGNFNVDAPVSLLLYGNVSLGAPVTITQVSNGGSLGFYGAISGAQSLTFNATGASGLFTLGGVNTYAGLTTVQGNSLVSLGSMLGNAIPGDLLISSGSVYGNISSDRIADTSRVTVNSNGLTVGSLNYEGLSFANGQETIGELLGTGRVGLISANLSLGAGNFSGLIVDSALNGSSAPSALNKISPGQLVLSGNNTFSGAINVNAGTLFINGNQSAATGLVSVNSGGTLGGSGTIGGSVVVNDGGILASGNSPGTLTILGDLALDAGSALNYEFGAAGTAGGAFNDLINVGGNLTLAGTLNLTQSTGGTFGPGVYRLFNYGTLTNNGLVIGSAPVPASDLYVQTSVANQVNLVNTNGLNLVFWDGGAGSVSKNNGAIDGGNGVWENGPLNDNWTTADGSANAPWTSGAFAVFQGTAGTVSLPVSSNFGPVVFSGAQFTVDGYTIAGGALTTSAQGAVLRVGDGTTAGPAYTATIAAELTGTGSVEKTDAGTLVLTGANTYTGGTVISGGALLANNTTGSATGTGAVAVNANGVLAGTGSVTGPVSVNSGGRIAGVDGQVLTVGALTLNAGSFTDVTLGAPNISALFQVNGALTLGGALNVIDAGGFGQGLYRLFDYTGGLTDNGMTVTSGTLAGYSFSLQTSTANQVNLISALGGPASIWDGGNADLHDNGSVNGGSGVWKADASDRSWTGANGSTNGFWSQDAFVIFQGAPGTVTVDNSAGAVTFSGAQFAVNGYTLAGAALTTTTADTVLRVGDGTAAGANFTATISAPITGAGGVRKTDFGTLVLSGANTYTGGTTVSSGVLQVGADSNLGATGAPITLDGGTLRYGAGFASMRNISLAGGGVIDTQTYNAAINGGLSGAGALIKTGAGMLTLSGTNTHTGATTIAQGGLVLQNSSLGQTLVGSGAGLFGNGTIRGSLTNQGVISPGFSPGVIAVNGNFTQTSTGSLFIELASPTSFDQFQVNGTSNLGGALVVTGLSGLTIQAGDTYRIMEANAINGQFDTLTSPWANLSPMIRFEALYSPTAVTLSFTQLPFTGLPGGSANQDSIGTALDTAFQQGRLPTLRGQLNAQPSQAAVAEKLRNIGPQRLARWFEQSNYISSAIVSSAAERLSDDVRVPQWNSWLELVHRESWFKGDADVDGAKGSTNGIITGADFAVTPDFVVGVLGGYTDESVELDLGGSETGIARYTTGAYGRYDFSRLFFESVAGVSYADYDSRRTTALNGQADGDTRGAEHFASVKAGVPFDLGGFGFVPSTSVQHVRWGADRFSEAGAGDENLTLFDQHGESITTRGNFTFSKKFKRDKKRLVIKTKLDVSWWHEVQQERREINAAIGDVPFTVLSRLPNSDGYIMMLSADFTYRSFFTGFVRVTSEWSTTANRALEFRAGANYKF